MELPKIIMIEIWYRGGHPFMLNKLTDENNKEVNLNPNEWDVLMTGADFVKIRNNKYEKILDEAKIYEGKGSIRNLEYCCEKKDIETIIHGDMIGWPT